MPDRVIPLISVPPTVRRRSLVEELVGADPSVASSRVNTVLSELSPAERSIVLKDYEAAQGPSAAEQQPFFMARLLDALFDRKSKVGAVAVAATVNGA